MASPANTPDGNRCSRALIYTCHGCAQIDAIRTEATAVGVSEATLQQVMRVAQLGSTAAVDPVEFCLLLVTTVSTDTPSLLTSLMGVFGEAGAMDADLCKEVFAVLGKHDNRLGESFQAAMDEQLAGAERIGHNMLVEMPCIKALC